MLPLGWPSPQDFSRARFRKRWTSFVHADGGTPRRRQNERRAAVRSVD